MYDHNKQKEISLLFDTSPDYPSRIGITLAIVLGIPRVFKSHAMESNGSHMTHTHWVPLSAGQDASKNSVADLRWIFVGGVTL